MLLATRSSLAPTPLEFRVHPVHLPAGLVSTHTTGAPRCFGGFAPADQTSFCQHCVVLWARHGLVSSWRRSRRWQASVKRAT